MAAVRTLKEEFPCSILISVPFPTARLASTALRALQVDEELSPLVRRSFSLASAGSDGDDDGITAPRDREEETVLQTHYRATTNRMLRVSVNGFFESLALTIQIMEELDVDVLRMATVAETTGTAETVGPVAAEVGA